MLLAIDTSTHYASVALHDRSALLGEHTWLARQDHTRTLLPNVKRLLQDAGCGLANLSAVAIALGPGSFNGLRVGLSTAKGLAIARGIPLVGASTLELIGREYGWQQATMSAGRGRAYRLRLSDGETPSDPASNIELIDGQVPDRVRHAGILAELGWKLLDAGRILDVARIEPMYVQPPHITESARKRHMLPSPQDAGAAGAPALELTEAGATRAGSPST